MRAKDKLIRDAKRRPSPSMLRNRRRYSAFLNAKDAYPELTFREFLTHPYFEDARLYA